MRIFSFHKLIALAAVLSLLLSMFGCSREHTGTAQIYALDTVIDITAYGENAEKALSEAKAEIRRLESLLSVTDDSSDIYRINHAEGEYVSVSQETYELIKKAVDISRLTDGAFDITVYNAVKLWGFTTGEYRVPASDEIHAVLGTVGSENVSLDADNRVAAESGAQLDLGGIAKGYIADKAAQAMADAGIEYGIISLGGNVRTIGQKPQSENFVIGIRHPEGNDHFVQASVQECSVITSGAYQRNFTEDGVVYHHIIDPKTGKPSQSDSVSVTVIGEDGALCDALSTAIFIGGTEYAQKLRKAEDCFEYIILTEDGTVFASKELEGNLSLSNVYNDLQIEYR